MPNLLGDALSPYLRQHADNPVDWHPWGAEPFAEAERRGVPVFVSIGYSTCHWCHVMARESFSNPAVAAFLNEHFVAIKVDREEHPEVDAAYLAAASAFTRQLGWPLNVFTTPRGRAFYAGTYWPPRGVPGLPAFAQVLDGVAEAWAHRRDDLEATAREVGEAIAALGAREASPLPARTALDAVVESIETLEDAEYGGFGSSPKFPVAPVLGFLIEHGTPGALALAERTLVAMAASPLRDAVEGGFFRYATRRDWSEPHYERMLYDNAQLLSAYAALDSREPAEGVARFLLEVLHVPGGIASAQNSESLIDGRLSEGGYYARDAAGRASLARPALDAKVLTGWNGLAIGALAVAGERLAHPEWVEAAAELAQLVLAQQRTPSGSLARATLDGAVSPARATLEDYGLLARGLLDLALATGEPQWASAARDLVEKCLRADELSSQSPSAQPPSTQPSSSQPPGAGRAPDAVFAIPGGGDPVLADFGLEAEADPSEGAYPSGTSALASASHTLYLLTGEARFEEAARAAVAPLATLAAAQPLGFGATLGVLSALASPHRQLVIVTPTSHDAGLDPLTVIVRTSAAPGTLRVTVTEEQAAAWAAEGFTPFEGRTTSAGRSTAYWCEDFVCRLPVADPAAFAELIRANASGAT